MGLCFDYNIPCSNELKDYVDGLNSKFYNYNVAIEFLKRYPYEYIRTN